MKTCDLELMTDKLVYPMTLSALTVLTDFSLFLTAASPFPTVQTQNPAGLQVSFEARLVTTIPEEFDAPGYGGWAVEFSPDGSRAAYQAKQAHRWFVVVGDRRGPDFDMVYGITFNPTGSVAYQARLADKSFIMLDGKRGPEFDYSSTDGISGEIVFSTDGSKVSYPVEQNGKMFMMNNTEREPSFEKVAEQV